MQKFAMPATLARREREQERTKINEHRTPQYTEPLLYMARPRREKNTLKNEPGEQKKKNESKKTVSRAAGIIPRGATLLQPAQVHTSLKGNRHSCFDNFLGGGGSARAECPRHGNPFHGSSNGKMRSTRRKKDGGGGRTSHPNLDATSPPSPPPFEQPTKKQNTQGSIGIASKTPNQTHRQRRPALSHHQAGAKQTKKKRFGAFYNKPNIEKREARQPHRLSVSVDSFRFRFSN